jgi:hypothetical protein
MDPRITILRNWMMTHIDARRQEDPDYLVYLVTLKKEIPDEHCGRWTGQEFDGVFQEVVDGGLLMQHPLLEGFFPTILFAAAMQSGFDPQADEKPAAPATTEPANVRSPAPVEVDPPPRGENGELAPIPTPPGDKWIPHNTLDGEGQRYFGDEAAAEKFCVRHGVTDNYNTRRHRFWWRPEFEAAAEKAGLSLVLRYPKEAGPKQTKTEKDEARPKRQNLFPPMGECFAQAVSGFRFEEHHHDCRLDEMAGLGESLKKRLADAKLGTVGDVLNLTSGELERKVDLTAPDTVCISAAFVALTKKSE